MVGGNEGDWMRFQTTPSVSEAGFTLGIPTPYLYLYAADCIPGFEAAFSFVEHRHRMSQLFPASP